jgi:hypothetical protein
VSPDPHTLAVSELVDARTEDDATPSCSVRMSLASQGLFVNDVVVGFAAQLLKNVLARQVRRISVVAADPSLKPRRPK